MPKMHRNTFGGQAAPRLAVGAYALRRSPSRNEDLLLRGGAERGNGRKPSSKGDGREGKEGRGDGN